MKFAPARSTLLTASMAAAAALFAGCQPHDPPEHERVSIKLAHRAPDAGCLDVYCTATVDAKSGEAVDNRPGTGAFNVDAMADLYGYISTLPNDSCPPDDSAPWRLDYAVYPPPSIAERADLAVYDVPWCHLDQQTLDELRPLWEDAGGWWPASEP